MERDCIDVNVNVNYPEKIFPANGFMRTGNDIDWSERPANRTFVQLSARRATMAKKKKKK
jgi:hypothetical protein